MDNPPPIAFRALRLERTGIARRGIGPVDDDALGVLDPLSSQRVTSRTRVRVVGRIVGKFVLPIERPAVIHVGERDIGPDPGVLQSDDVLDARGPAHLGP